MLYRQSIQISNNNENGQVFSEIIKINKCLYFINIECIVKNVVLKIGTL